MSDSLQVPPSGAGSQEPPFVSVIVPVLNGEDTVDACLSSLNRLSYPAERREILVVDNASTDRTASLVRNHPVTYIREDRRGLSYARNCGIEASRGEILAFTDSDCLVSTNWLTDLVEGFKDRPTAGAVVGEVVAFPPSTPAEHYMAARKPLSQMWGLQRDPPTFVFMNAALPRAVFDQVGGFDAGFAGGGCEDNDFCWRFYLAGLQAHYVPKAIVFHRHRATLPAFFKQQRGYGRGQAVLYRKHKGSGFVNQWGTRAELRAWSDIAATGWTALNTQMSRSKRQHGSYNHAYVDLLRKLGQRIGFIEGNLKAVRQGTRVRSSPDASALEGSGN